jgi:DNA polymerase III alpha subunit
LRSRFLAKLERNDLLFERFVSAERAEPPDIDVDFDAAAAKR